jgi:hypothetical protein
MPGSAAWRAWGTPPAPALAFTRLAAQAGEHLPPSRVRSGQLPCLAQWRG